MSTAPDTAPTFRSLGLAEPLLEALTAVGYETPTPIQARTIPPLLAGRDLLGQAQTGTGKTAAFALPLLSRLQPGLRQPQVLVLTPTRELGIQVAEAFQRYGAQLPGLHVLPIYGGQDYGVQLKALARGAQVVVGTPGRIMDHLRRGTLVLGALQALVLDEADEMLRMGFIDDVEWILGHTPPTRQLALFSATLPGPVRQIAARHLREPEEVRLESRSAAAASVRQRVWIVSGTHKLDALTRILEVEDFDAMIVFVRTRHATTDLAERLSARGFDAAAIHGDVPQRQRERLIADLKQGKLDILVATDVAARGLDVERVSHVVNFDIPYDAEAYVHRIGRTGRAGRSGEAILFAAPRERHMLRTIERATGRPIEIMELPSHEAVSDVRVRRFFESLNQTLADVDLEAQVTLLTRYQHEHAVDPLTLAAAVAHLGGVGLPQRRSKAPARKPAADTPTTGDRPEPPPQRPRADRPQRAERPQRPERPARADRPARPDRDGPPPEGLERFRLEVGREHGAEPRHIVGAIANEAGMDAQHIGRVVLFDDHSTVELPAGMPVEIFRHLKRVWVAGQQLQISRLDGPPEARGKRPPARKPAGGKAPGKKPSGGKPAARKPKPPKPR
ncbi:MAG: DEAD/DEAH box helicase [Pseudomonadales bacterium]